MIKRNNKIEDLEKDFQKKVKAFLEEAKEKFKIEIFEWYRTYTRQLYLYSLWRTREWKKVTWTLNSDHFTWKAIDIVFRDENNKITWEWNYRWLAKIAEKYWIRNLWIEKWVDFAHFYDNWKASYLYIKKKHMSKYNKLFTVEVKNKVFSNHEWEWTLTEKEIKQLIEIAIERKFKNLEDIILEKIKQIFNKL